MTQPTPERPPPSERPAVIQERPPMDTEPGGIIQEPTAERAETSAPTPEGEALHF